MYDSSQPMDLTPALTSPAPDPTLELAIRGDTAARSRIVDRHGPRVYALCRRLAADPEDCYQEIWEKVLKALDRFDPAGTASLGGWISVIARRHLTDRHRRLKVRGEVVPLAGIPAVDEGIDERIAARQRRDRLEAAIVRLPYAQRQVVVLHHIQGVSLEEIAADEDLSLGTVKSRLHRGRARLSALLGARR